MSGWSSPRTRRQRSRESWSQVTRGLHLAQVAQAVREVMRGCQGGGVVLAQDPAAAVQGVLGQVAGGPEIAQGAQVGGQVLRGSQGGGVVLAQDQAAAVEVVLVQGRARLAAPLGPAGHFPGYSRRRASPGWSSPWDPALPVEGVLVQVAGGFELAQDAQDPRPVPGGAQGVGVVLAEGTWRRRSRLSWSRSRAARTSPRRLRVLARSLAVVKVAGWSWPKMRRRRSRVSWARSRACARVASRLQRPAEVVSDRQGVLVIGAEPVTPPLAQVAGEIKGDAGIAAGEQVAACVAGQLAQAGVVGGGQVAASRCGISRSHPGQVAGLSGSPGSLAARIASVRARVAAACSAVSRSRRMAWVSRCITRPRWSMRASDWRLRCARVCRQASGSAGRAARS